MRVWFNKTFSSIHGLFVALHEVEEITIVCSHVHRSAAAFLAADEHHIEPAELSGDEYLHWCLDFCQQQNIDWFWVGKESALMARHHAQFADIGVRVVSVASSETLNLINNKAEFYAAVPKDVAQVMDFVAVTTPEQFDAAVTTLSQQHEALCVKPSESVFGLGFRVLDTERNGVTQLLDGAEYQIPFDELRYGMTHTPNFDSLLVMEHLDGHEWSVDCVGQHGKLLCAVQRKKALQAGYGQIIDNHPDIAGMVERLTAYYELNGIFNIQFKEGQHGVRLLEINPRPSGGFGMACLAGVNLAKLAWQSLNGHAITPKTPRYGAKVSEVKTPVLLLD